MSNTPQNPQANKLMRGDARASNDRLKQAAAATEQQAAERWNLRTIKDRGWSSREPTPTPALLNHGEHTNQKAGGLAVPRGELVMLVGAGGLGKSMATMQLAISLTTGKPWLGFDPCPTGGLVVLICAEDNEQTMHRRFKDCAAKMNLLPHEAARAESMIVPIPGDEGVPLLVQQRFDADKGEVVDEGEHMAALTQQLHQLGGEVAEGLALIILDPSVKFMPAEGEERAAVASRFVDALKGWTRTLPGKPSVMLVHHTTKSARKDAGHTAEAARGSSSLTDSVRCQINLFNLNENGKANSGPRLASNIQSDEQLYLCVSKSNYGPLGYAVRLVRDLETGVLLLAAPDHIDAQASEGGSARRSRSTLSHLPEY